jgi:D-3-phosphoglycerate dehydrogenase / 2-oxoglutarate reductase
MGDATAAGPPAILLTHPPQTRALYYGERALAGLRALGEVRLNPTDRVLALDELVKAARGCRVIVSDRQTAAPAALFAQAGDALVAFLRCAVDIRNVDVAAASAAGVLVTQATPGFIAAVAEMAVGCMIDLGRRITASAMAYRVGQAPPILMGRQLAGSTLGIVGYGAIGRYLARLGAALGMRVLVTDPHQRVEDPALTQLEFTALLAQADFIVCLAVAAPETENLFDRAAFAHMRPDAVFLNLSRGNLVDEAALLAALESGTIAGAALDVGRAPDQMPSPALARHPKVIATPHTAGLTPPAIEHQAMETVAQAREILAGRVPPGAVNAAHWKRGPS